MRTLRLTRATALGALLVVGLAGCSLLSAPRSSSESGSAPVNPESAVPAASIARVSPASGTVKGGTTLTVTGESLGTARSAALAGTTVPVTVHDGKVEVRTPAAARFVPATDTLTLRNAAGATIASAHYRYRITDGVDRELAYVLKYWKHYNPAYEVLADNDCVDFTSQALLQRGWKQQGDWVHAADVLDSGLAWRSSTSFRDFMEQHPELGTALTDQQRSKVKLGDIVQFDWDRTGDRDHTGVVTRITKSKSGKIEIYFAGHTNDSDYRSVDTAITKDHPGGIAYYWSLK